MIWRRSVDSLQLPGSCFFTVDRFLDAVVAGLNRACHRGGIAMGDSRTAFFQTCLGVFQGGGCRAAAYAGAFEVATSRGVHFAGVAGTSAGALAAALIGAGASPSQMTNAIRQLDFNRFISSPATKGQPSGLPALVSIAARLIPVRPYRHLLLRRGMYSSTDIQKWTDQQLRLLLEEAPSPIRFRDLVLPTWIVATDLATRRVKVWSSYSTKAWL
jgi:predicted acylesterase/phospholipase RssA